MLRFQNISKKFQDIPILEDISFNVDPGDFFFVTGPSGAGKTTLMKLLTKYELPTSGEIQFQNKLLSQIKGKDLLQHRRKVGVVFQDYKLLHDLNAWENIALALEILGKKNAEIEERVSDLLKLVGLQKKAGLFPSQLSGGEAQRVSIARALASAPALIFADEPTGNLDPESSQIIFKLLKKINELGTTVLMATHDISLLDEYKGAKHLHLEKGRITGGNVKEEGKKKPKGKKDEKASDKQQVVSKKEEKDLSTDARDDSQKPKAAEDANKKKDEKKSGPRMKLWPFGGKGKKDESKKDEK